MDLKEFNQEIITKINNGTLITEKHNPYFMEQTSLYNKWWSVVSHEMYDSIERINWVEDFSITEYTNLANKPLYISLEPKNLKYQFIASGCTKNDSTINLEVLDRLIIVNGPKPLWHMFGEYQSKIDQKIRDGKLVYKHRIC